MTATFTLSARHFSRAIACGSLVIALATGFGAPAASAAPVATSATVATGVHLLPSHVSPAKKSKKSKKVKKTKITTNLAPTATINAYGTRTSAKLSVTATGTKLKYTWQYRTPANWTTIAGAKKSSYTVTSSIWKATTSFRVIVKGKKGTATSKTSKVSVLYPSPSPATDAQTRFGLPGLRQGIDISAWQYGGNTRAITDWVGPAGFVLLRNGSGARPVDFAYTDPCSKQNVTTGKTPTVKDCAYAGFADAVTSAKRGLGHYWFNGWIDSIDTTANKAFSNGFTPTTSADQFVSWLLSDGNYTTSSTDPLVLDIEPGGTKTKTVDGKQVKLTLRAWTSAESLEFLTRVKTTLTAKGYHPNLYVYMGSKRASAMAQGQYVWTDVASVAKLWVASWGSDNGRVPDAQPIVGPWATAAGNEGWSIWQYTSNARISGFNGPLDADLAKASAWTPRP